MSVEAGSAHVRNKVLKRNMSDDILLTAFHAARKNGIGVWGTTILGIPGTTLQDDYESTAFVRKLKIAYPAFTIFAPYPGTELTQHSIDLGLLDKDYDYNMVSLTGESVLKGYTPEEKKIQLNLFYLAPFFCLLPEPLFKTLPWFAKRFSLTPIYRILGGMWTAYLLGTRIFPGARPKGLAPLWDAIKVHLATRIKKHTAVKSASMSLKKRKLQKTLHYARKRLRRLVTIVFVQPHVN